LGGDLQTTPVDLNFSVAIWIHPRDIRIHRCQHRLFDDVDTLGLKEAGGNKQADVFKGRLGEAPKMSLAPADL